MNKVEALVAELFAIKGIKDCGIITLHGNPVALRLSNGVDPKVFSAMSATIYGAAASLSQDNGGDRTVEVTIKNGKNELTIKKCGEKTLLTVVKDKKINGRLISNKQKQLGELFDKINGN